ncbi:hypothetical protein D3C86_2205590 [compost metagenome]
MYSEVAPGVDTRSTAGLPLSVIRLAGSTTSDRSMEPDKSADSREVASRLVVISRQSALGKPARQ